MRKNFDIYTQDGKLYERIFTAGEDEDECEEGLSAYLDRLQNCYALPSDDEDDEDK
jgi:hypothetical protein